MVGRYQTTVINPSIAETRQCLELAGEILEEHETHSKEYKKTATAQYVENILKPFYKLREEAREDMRNQVAPLFVPSLEWITLPVFVCVYCFLGLQRLQQLLQRAGELEETAYVLPVPAGSLEQQEDGGEYLEAGTLRELLPHALEACHW